MFRLFIFLCGFGALSLVGTQSAEAKVYRAVVLEASEFREIADEHASDFDISNVAQDIVVSLRTDSGDQKVELSNDFIALEQGDRILIQSFENLEGGIQYTVIDIDRFNVLLSLLGLFLILVVLFAGPKGVKAIISLAVSIGIFFWVLLPAMLAGHNVLLLGIGIAVVLLGLVMVIAHGPNKVTLAAFCGTSVAIIVTGILTHLVLQIGGFTGIGTDDAFALVTAGISLPMTQILFVSIIIGMLGVLDDIAVTQSVTVLELKNAGMRGKELYASAMRIGKDHVAALVNTLIFAYAGVSMPLLLLLTTYTESISVVVSAEFVAIEIVRALIGSIGIILTVPVTTLLAMFFTADKKDLDQIHAHKH